MVGKKQPVVGVSHRVIKYGKSYSITGKDQAGKGKEHVEKGKPVRKLKVNQGSRKATFGKGKKSLTAADIE